MPKQLPRRICVMTSSRTDYSRLKTVLEELYRIKNVQPILVVSGPHLLTKYGRTVVDIERDGFKVDERAYTLVEGENPTTMSKSVGLSVVEFTSIYNNQKPDIVVVHGDRFENFAAGVAAALMNIPIAHLQGGEISGTIDESLRHSLTKLSHLHFPSNEASRERILRLGEDARYVFNFGCPATDLLLRKSNISKSKLFSLPEVTPKDERRLDPKKPYALAILHPVTTEYGKSYHQMTEFLEALRVLDMQTIMLYPNPDAGSEDMITAVRHYLLRHPLHNVFMYKNFHHEVFAGLLRHADLMIGNSSTGVRETCYFGTPTVNIGTREQHRDRGRNVIEVANSSTAIIAASRKQLRHGRYPIEQMYGSGSAGKKIAQKLSTIVLPPIQKTISY